MLIFKETLTSLHKRLAPHGFIRCHKSYLVSVTKIKAFNSEGIELGGALIPIGRSYKEEVLRLLQDNQ
jgi:DNA-binding LytR/AlgR family response regulator